MGCLLGCFGRFAPLILGFLANRFELLFVRSDKAEEEKHSTSPIPNPSPSPTRKKVTFDSNVKTYEPIAVDESIELLEEKKVEEKPLKKSECSSDGSDVTSNSSGSYPSNHRYQNCRESDDEEEEEEEEDVTDCDESDIDDEVDYCGFILPEEDFNDDKIYEDRLQSWDKEVYTEEITDNVLDIEKKKPNVSVRDRSGYVNAVLNPIENLTQWKAVKSRGTTTTTTTTQIQSRKENANLISSELNASFSLEEPRVSVSKKARDETKKQTRQEVAVDASLSTWLSVTSQTSGCSSVSNYSKPVQSYDERPILGALTSEEIKQFSATNSPRKSPSRSPESPIIGTVGGYWNNHSMTINK
ncbi:unnamed protein product [Thlaspi arvense]|uniref:Uncharacterized protein n=1 Tax=Thlaspi arvense TaxID=13288 RepID=A0AAU9RNW0_THLAR|nr:unnamed protein product [Thlaspi arvense]